MARRYLHWQDHLPQGRLFGVNVRLVEPYPLHAHDYYEMEIVLEGHGQQMVNGHPEAMNPGTVYLLSPGDFHEITAARNVRLYNIVFDEGFVSGEELQELFGPLPFCGQIPEDRRERLSAAVDLLAGEESHHLGRPLMEYVLRLCAGKPADSRPITPIRRAILYIESHYRENPSLADAARVACLSPVYFGNRFRAETGKTYVEYLNGCKLACAKLLLREGLSVTETCFRAGFGSLSGFLYAFKRAEGISPTAYQKQVRRQ